MHICWDVWHWRRQRLCTCKSEVPATLKHRCQVKKLAMGLRKKGQRCYSLEANCIWVVTKATCDMKAWRKHRTGAEWVSVSILLIVKWKDWILSLVLELPCASESSRKLVKTSTVVLTFQTLWLSGSGVGPVNLHLQHCPGDSNAGG